MSALKEAIKLPSSSHEASRRGRCGISKVLKLFLSLLACLLLAGPTAAENGEKKRFLVAIAENDDEQEPEAKNTLRESFANAMLFAEIEVYEDAMHGWCPPDSPVYYEEQAERAWSRLLALFDRHLV